MKKVFISLPMADKSNEEIHTNFTRAIKEIGQYLNKPIEVVDSLIDSEPQTQNPGIWFLGKSLEMMADADIVYFAEGHELARGCKIECSVACAYGMKIVTHADIQTSNGRNTNNPEEDRYDR